MSSSLERPTLSVWFESHFECVWDCLYWLPVTALSPQELPPQAEIDTRECFPNLGHATKGAVWAYKRCFPRWSFIVS